MIFTRFLIFFSLLFVCTGLHANWLSQYANRVEDKAKTHNITGYAWTFVQTDGRDQLFTYGKTHQSGAAITPSTVFRLASVSKTFTGVLVSKLVAAKQLHWQMPISQLAPDYGFSPAGADGIQLKHLLNQSSGYMPNAYDNLIEANYSLKRVLNKLADLEPLCKPGQCYTYQNALFGVLEDYFAQQNNSYRHTLNQQIIQPLNMPHASVGKAALLSSDSWARPHVAIARDKFKQGKVQSNYYRFSPAAGVNASIEDMRIWVHAMLGEYPQVVPPAIIEQVSQPNTKTKRELRRRHWRKHLTDAHYGLGWRVYEFAGQTLIYHGGWVKGYRADIAFAPEQKVGFAMLMNAESNQINQFSADFWASYFGSLEENKLAKNNAN